MIVHSPQVESQSMEEAITQPSVLEPLGPAVERVKTLLFRPFEIERWFAIALCAWLALLGTGGGSAGQSVRYSKEKGVTWNGKSLDTGPGKEFVMENLAWIVPVTLFVLIVLFGLWLVLTWLSSRGRFMFLHCVAAHCAEVQASWSQYRVHANSLFVFRLLVGIVTLVLAMGISVLGFFLVTRSSLLSNWGPWGSLAFLVPLGLLLSLTAGLAGLFTNDFVVPIMRLRTQSCFEAWGIFLDLLVDHPGSFVLYLLTKLVINIAVWVSVVLLSVVTCSCACCLMALPFVGTVLLLPVYVFKRSYSLFYLRQYGPAFDSFAVYPPAIPEPPLE